MVKDFWFKLFVSAIVITIWIATMVSFGNFVREKTRCEMQHGTYATLDRSPVCIGPAGIKTIDVSH